MPVIGNQEYRVGDWRVGDRGFLEWLPNDYGSTGAQTYPCLIFLHGAGEKGDGTSGSGGLQKLLVNGPPKEIAAGANMQFTVNSVLHKFIVLSPQLATGVDWYSSTTNNWVSYFLLNYRINTNRLYITGLSLGGGGCWDILCSNTYNSPNKFAASFICAGYAGANSQADFISKNVAVKAIHGDADGTVNINLEQPFVNGCNSGGANPQIEYTALSGYGHNVWDYSYRVDNTNLTPNIYQWLLARTLSSAVTAAFARVKKSIRFRLKF